MTVRILPDTEAIVVAYLLGRAEVTAIFGDRIGTQLDLTKPAELSALRIRRISTTTPVRRHLRAANVQLEAWDPTELNAQDGCETALAALHEDDAGIVGTWPPYGVVTGVEDAIGARAQADPETGTPRWLASVLVYAHPIPQ